jgi:hypothetical protein
VVNSKAAGAWFSGRWIGETQGWEMPAHIWDIIDRGSYLYIVTRWEDETHVATFYGQLLPDEDAFLIGQSKAMRVDAQHFWIPEWDTNDTRGGVGPNYDVVFSRPGIAELAARQVWLRVRETKK